MKVRSEIEAVAAVAERYYRAMVAGDRARLRALFDARAPVAGAYEGDFLWLDLEAFVAEAESLAGQHGAEECTVESVRVDGDIAAAVVRGRYMRLWFVDHLAMVRQGHDWIIVAKTFCVAG